MMQNTMIATAILAMVGQVQATKLWLKTPVVQESASPSQATSDLSEFAAIAHLFHQEKDCCTDCGSGDC